MQKDAPETGSSQKWKMALFKKETKEKEEANGKERKKQKKVAFTTQPPLGSTSCTS
jgi:hypothetical protein